MNWLTTIWAMIASASLAIAAVYLVAWLRARESPAYLMFALLTISVSTAAGTELWMMHADTAEEFNTALRWFHVPIFLAVAACAGLVYYRLDSDKPWLGWAAVALRALSLVANFVSGENLNYLEITELRKVEILGEHVSMVSGVANPWMLLGQLSLALLLVYILDAAVGTWRRHRGAMRVALSIVLLALVLAGVTQAIVGFWGFAPIPVIVSPFFIGVAVVMGVDLSIDLLRAPRLEGELRASRVRLESLSNAAALSEMATSIAHEINQPLGVIHSNAEAAQMQLDNAKPDLEELRETIADIVKADRRASDVIKRLRALVHVDEPNRLALNLNDVVEKAIDHLRDDLRGQGVQLETHLDRNLPPVAGDRTLLIQMLMNLISNAAEAVAANSAGQRRVSIATRQEDHKVQVTVTDNGQGLPENVDQIFDPFFTSKRSGLGMGLPVARSIVTAHEGSIGAGSIGKNRTFFCVSLPAKID